MKDKSKTIEGEVINVSEGSNTSRLSPSPQGRSVIVSGLETIRLIGERRAAKIKTEIASHENDYGDELVRSGEITLELKSLEAKVKNIHEVAEAAKQEVIGDRLEQENRVQILEAEQRMGSLRAQAQEAELRAQIAQAQAQANFYEGKLNDNGASEKSIDDQIAAAYADFQNLLAELDEAKIDAGGKLPEPIARDFDIRIGEAMRKLQDLKAKLDEPETPPFE